MKDIGLVILFLMFGVVLGIMFHGVLCCAEHTKPMDALGIERFQRCEINTTNCHSNWYEIIWNNKDNINNN